jgi:nitronate monooxygenase
MSVEQVRENYARVRAHTNRPFNINFFTHDPPGEPSDGAEAMRNHLLPYYDELGVNPEMTLANSPMRSFDEDMLHAVLDLKPTIVSFHFGLPCKDFLIQLKSQGIVILSTATTVHEAHYLEQSGVDAIVAQGMDAGGHRGTFLKPLSLGSIGTFSLVPQIVDAVSVPVIAAGGVTDGRGIAAAFALGASGVQMGTAFLCCPESITAHVHRQALRDEDACTTVVTSAYTGRPARAIVNRFIRETEPRSQELAPFPLQDSLTYPLHLKGVELQSRDFVTMFAGQAASLTHACPVKQLVQELTTECMNIMNRGHPK